jgi:heptosyltransferase-1
MKRVLITKLSSLGDLILALPALSDAKAALGYIEFDWVVDKNFQEIPLWHPSVKELFVTNHRAWRKSLTKKATYQEFSTLYQKLKQKQYDLIIDAHSNIKSGLLSLIPQGKRAGFDGSSTPEWGSQFFYQETHRASKELHATERLRILFASALNYPLPSTKPNYQINLAKLKKPDLELPSQYLIFVPIASHDSKLWPEAYWKELIAKTVEKGHPILLPWGNLKEQERVERLKIHPLVQVLPKLSLNEIGYLIANAEGVVSLDTGLSHIAAALAVPCITLYGPTDPNLTGTVGENQFWARSPDSMDKISSESIWDNLRRIVSN